MKKRIIALVLAAVLLLALTGCGSFTPRMIVSLQKMSKLTSLHSDTVVGMGIKLELLGQKTDLELTANAAGDHQKDPSLSAVDLELSFMDVTQQLLLYTERRDKVLVVYVSLDGGESWTRRDMEAKEVQTDALSEINFGDLLKLAIGLAECFEEAGTVTVQGSEATLYKGVIPAEYVRQALASVKLSEDFTLDEDAISQVGDVPVSLAIDNKSGMIVQISTDLTEALRGLILELLSQYLDLGVLDAAVNIEIEHIETVTELSRFDSVTVSLPEM